VARRNEINVQIDSVSSEAAVAPIEFECDNLAVRLDVELPGDAAAISPVVDRVLALTKDVGCAQGKEFEIETALREALANAVRYGCAHNPSKKVQLSVACDQDLGMIIVVRDPGPGFDPSQVPTPIAAEQLFSHHGRGIFLISQLMDRVEFGHGGREIRMHKR
jgi:serine/threonine-protein kinase RsbW